MNENQFKTKGFIVWIICAVFFMYEFLLRTVVGSFQAQLMQDLHLTFVHFSLLSTTIFLIVYGIMQIPVGIIIENIGLKKSLCLASSVCALATLGFSYSTCFQWALFFRMLMGVGASFGFIGLLMSVNDWMPRKYIAIFIGLSQFIGTLGPMIAAGPLESISSSPFVNWRVVFFALGIIGLIIASFILMFVENNQHSSGKYVVLARPEKILTLLKKLFLKSQPWVITVVATCMYFAIEYLSENEGRIFLNLKGISSQSASNTLSISWIGFAIGCPLVGVMSDLFERRKSIISSCSLIGFISICMIVFPHNKLVLQFGFFFLGVGASGISVAYAMIAEHFKQQFVAVGFGMTNAILMSISAVNAPLIGFVIESFKSSGESALQSYTFAFFSLVGISVLGLVVSLFFIKETFCKSKVDFTILKTNL